jgi:hypothetical protein
MALGHTAAAHEVDDQHYDGNHQQQMNQTAGYVKAKAKKPKNQKHNENRPKHVDLLRSFNRCRSERPGNLSSFTLASTLSSPVRAIFRIPGKTASIAM